MYKISLLIGSFIFTFYLGLLPLLGFKVWSKYKGWVDVSNEKAIVSVIIGVILFYIYSIAKKVKG